MHNKHPQRSGEDDDLRKLRCTHCGGSRHTKESCFKIVGYPEWWDEFQKRRAATKAPSGRTGGKAHLATIEPPSSQDFSGMMGCEEEGERGTLASHETEERETAARCEGEGRNFPKITFYNTPQTLKTLTHDLPTHIPSTKQGGISQTTQFGLGNSGPINKPIP